MATDSAYSGDDPRRLLSSSRELIRRVRMAQRATWFPLLVFATVTFAAIPASQVGRGHFGTCVPTPPAGKVCTVYSYVGFSYWPIAFVMAGIILALTMTGAVLWSLYHPPGTAQALPTVPGLFPLAPGVRYSFAIGLALLVLAWAERNRALLFLTVGYLAVVLVPISFGSANGHGRWAFAPQLVTDGSVLLLGGIGFLLAQRPWRRA